MTYPLHELTSASAFAMEFEISLLDENLFYFGSINDLAYDALTNEIFSFSTSSGGPNNPNWIHLDIREMKIVPGENNTAKRTPEQYHQFPHPSLLRYRRQ